MTDIPHKPYKLPDVNETITTYKGITRKPGIRPCWVVTIKNTPTVFYDFEFDDNWRFSLFQAEEFMRSNYHLRKVKIANSKLSY
jgi:phage pi2 protein 07